MGVGTSFDFNLTRDGVIRAAYRKVTPQDPNPQRMRRGLEMLNLIIRELDPRNDILWAVTKNPVTITLIANTFLYTTSNGLASNILGLETMVYRNASGTDKNLIFGTQKSYEAKTNKFQIGDPKFVFLTDDIVLSDRQLFVVPMLSSINSRSEVTGTDALNYSCIRSHTADSINKPVTGDNYLLYWEQTGSSGSAWVDGTSYTAPQLLRYTYRRPLWDFDLGRDNPDVPQSWVRKLILRLASDLADMPELGIDISTRVYIEAKGDKAEQAAISSTVKETTDFHNKTEFF